MLKMSGFIIKKAWELKTQACLQKRAKSLGLSVQMVLEKAH